MMNNTNISAIIVEDEPWAAQNLQSLIAKVNPRIKILTILDSVKECIPWFMKNSVDLVFMDIHLADGSCFEIFEEMRFNSPIIFTTAYDQYAIKAFKVNSIDYLLKPIKEDDLYHAIEKFENLSQQSPLNLQELTELFTQPRKYKQRFTVQAGSKIKTIPTQNIALFYMQDGAPYILTSDNYNYDIPHSLDKLELMLNPDQFFRINRQMIVNFEAIEEMYNLSKSRIGIKLKAKTQLETLVSFRKMPQFRDWIDR